MNASYPRRRTGLLICSAMLFALGCLQFAETTAIAQERPAGTPAISGTNPESQGEQDWIDNRWSHTDVGSFLSSTLKVPNGTITKSLSIRLGEQGEASVSFDLANLNVRAGWTGGFLKFDATRFGLLNLPQIDGDVQFVAPDGTGWLHRTGRFTGFHAHGKRVVLEYELNKTTVTETPWFEVIGVTGVFTRTFQVGPHDDELILNLLDRSQGRLLKATDSGSDRSNVIVAGKSNFVGVIVTGAGAKLSEGNDALLALKLSPSTHTQEIAVAIGAAKTEPNASFAESWLPDGKQPTMPDLIKPAAPRWLPALETVGERGQDHGALAIDTLTVPYANPWNALMFLSGVDFDSSGAAYLCTIHGDVWKVTGIDESLQKLNWKRYATGIYQALGLKVVNDQVYVLGRDQITRLHDENRDGEADFYEDFCNLIHTFPEPHHYVTSLETDAAGNFYFVDPVGVHRVSADGQKLETIATGFRNPNGMGVRPDGKVITVAPQQGEWTPASPIVAAQPNGYYGYGGPKITPDRPLGYDPVLCWIPHSVDNSGGSQVWIPDGQWGALGGHFIHFSWGRCFMMLVLRDEQKGVAQGATAALPGRFLSGAMRGSFNQRDGHLYVVGSTGWQTSALKDGSFQRVRYTNKAIDIPVAWHVHQNGITLAFAEKLDPETANDAGSFAASQWNYKYARSYGSKDWSVSDPEKEGHDTLEVRSAKLLDDGKSVFLEIPDLKPVMQLQIKYNVDTKEGAGLRNTLYGTINSLGSHF